MAFLAFCFWGVYFFKLERGSDKYFLNLEAVFLNQNDLDSYNHSIFRRTIPLHIHKPVMIISWNLKSEYVLKNCIKNNENKSY